MTFGKSRPAAFDLWDAASAYSRNPEDSDGIVKPRPRLVRRHLIVCGGKGAGKSTIIQRILEMKAAETKETIGIGYSYVKNQREDNLLTEIGNIWEIGSSPNLSELLEISLASLSIRDVMIFVVVDLSKPDTVMSVVTQCLQSLHEVIAKYAPDGILQDPGSFFGMPVWIIGSKADSMQGLNLELEKRQGIFQALQQCAMFAGAGLMYVSATQPSGEIRARAIVRNWFFWEEKGEQADQMEVTKLVYLIPKSSSTSAFSTNAKTVMERELDSARAGLHLHIKQKDAEEFSQIKQVEVELYREKEIDDIYTEANSEIAALIQGKKSANLKQRRL